jgi:hypothetical protein
VYHLKEAEAIFNRNTGRGTNWSTSKDLEPGILMNHYIYIRSYIDFILATKSATIM